MVSGGHQLDAGDRRKGRAESTFFAPFLAMMVYKLVL
jgi:hypothetical protein